MVIRVVKPLSDQCSDKHTNTDTNSAYEGLVSVNITPNQTLVGIEQGVCGIQSVHNGDSDCKATIGPMYEQTTPLDVILNKHRFGSECLRTI